MVKGTMLEMLKEIVGRSSALKEWPICRPCQAPMSAVVAWLGNGENVNVRMTCRCGKLRVVSVAATPTERYRIDTRVGD
jgi:hypothetical protein